MAIVPILSKEFAVIYGGEVIAFATDFTLEINKEVVDITKLGDDWKNKLVDTKDWNVSFNGMVTRGDSVTAVLWDPTNAYSAGEYCVLGGKAWEAQGSTTGDNPSTDDGTYWLETSVYSAPTTYAIDDMVYYTTVANENRIYVSLQNSNQGNNPPDSPTYWERYDTNYDSLLNDIKHNDEVVVVTIKPNVASTTYYYGNGYITGLTASVAVGDKMTFAGSFEGDDQLNSGTTT